MFRVPLFRPAAAAVSCSIWNDSKVQSLVGVGRQRTQPEESQPESEATASERVESVSLTYQRESGTDGVSEGGRRVWTGQQRRIRVAPNARARAPTPCEGRQREQSFRKR